MRPLFGRQRAILFHRLVAQPLKAAGASPLAFARIPPGDASLLAPLHREEAVVRERLDAGRIAHIALLGRQPVSVAWVARDAMHIWDLDLELMVGPSDAYVFDVYTAPAYRSLGIAAALDRALGADLAQDGVRGLVRCVMAANLAGLAAARKAGYLPRTELAFIRAIGLELHLVRHGYGRVAMRPSLAVTGRPYLIRTDEVVCAPASPRDGGGWLERAVAAAARRCVGPDLALCVEGVGEAGLERRRREARACSTALDE